MWTEKETSTSKTWQCRADIPQVDLNCGSTLFNVVKQADGIHVLECSLCGTIYPLTLVVNGNK